MHIEITNKNSVSLDVCQRLWGLTPQIDDWHMAIPFDGTEQSAEDVKGGLLFHCDSIAGHIAAINHNRIEKSFAHELVIAAARYLHKREIETLLLAPVQDYSQYDDLFGKELFEVYDRRFSMHYSLTDHITNLKSDFSKIHILTTAEDIRTKYIIELMLSEMREKSGYSYKSSIADLEAWKQTRIASFVLEKEVIGFVSFSSLYDPASPRNIQLVYVLPQYRGRGIGTLLCNFAKICLGPGDINLIDFYFADAPEGFLKHIGAELKFIVYGLDTAKCASLARSV